VVRKRVARKDFGGPSRVSDLQVAAGSMLLRPEPVRFDQKFLLGRKLQKEPQVTEQGKPLLSHTRPL